MDYIRLNETLTKRDIIIIIIIKRSFSAPSQLSPRRVQQTFKQKDANYYIVERTNKAEIRPEEQRDKVERCRESLWNEMQLKGPQRKTQEQNKTKRSGQARLVYVKDINRNIPTT